MAVILTMLMVFPASIFGSGARQNSMYRVSLKSSASKTLTVKVVGSTITIVGSGLSTAINARATGGGVSACRTTIEHTSPNLSIVLSLPIADPRAPCRKLPGYITIVAGGKSLYDEEPIRKVTGIDSKLRSAVRKLYGEEEE